METTSYVDDLFGKTPAGKVMRSIGDKARQL